MMIRRVLEIPVVYDFFQTIVGSRKRHRIVINDYIGNVEGLSILEIGCGTCDILSFLPGCSYTGVDLDQQYINKAKKRYKNRDRAQFICMDLNEFCNNCNEQYDLIMMTSVIHHINDNQVKEAMKSITKLIKPEGRFISYDPVYAKKMSKFELMLVDGDRGEYVRKEKEYVSIQKKYWKNISYDVRNDTMYLPFYGIYFMCSGRIEQ